MSVDFRVGLRSLYDEVTDTPLVPDRPLPGWLRGTLFRVGGAVLETPSGPLAHWFDGYAMAHRFRFDDGAVRYTNRIVQSPAYRAMVASGRPRYNEFMTVPERSLWEKLLVTLRPPTASGHNGLVNVVELGDTILALTEEPGGPRLDPTTLDTVGVLGYHDELGGLIDTAHPIADPARHCVWNLLTQVSPLGGLHYVPYRIDDGTLVRRSLARHRTDRISYLHSFGASENHLIVAEYPFVASLTRLGTMALTGRAYGRNYQWKPELGTRFLVFHKDTGELLGPFETDAAFSFHHANAYEDGSDLVVDVSVYADVQIVDALLFAAMRRPGGGDLPFSWLRRYRIDLTSQRITHTDIDTGQMYEMPQLNPRLQGRPCQQLYGYSFPREGPVDQFINQLIKVDADTGEHLLWHDDGCFPGEPVFVGRPGADRADDGVLLSVILDARVGHSALLVLDAATLGEICRVPMPFAVPYEFHGRFYGS
jgi:beta,beta-carotene 9',10'-dioxygenase